MAADLSLEQRVIIGCIKHALGHGRTAPLECSPDWHRVVSLSFQEGLAPLVHAGLPSLRCPAPDDVRAELRAAYLGTVVRTEVWVEPTLRRSLEALSQAGLEPIILKGAALAYSVYPQPAYRTLSDIDLLLSRNDVDRAGAALTQAGFQTRGAGPVATHHLPPYYLDEGGVGVEVHDRLLAEPHPYFIDSDRLHTRSRIARVAGLDARVLAPSDALLFTCIHLAYAHRYRWFPFRSLTDVLAITASRDEELDWNDFLESVRLSRTAGAVYWPLRFSSMWLGAPIPDSVLASLSPPELTRGWVESISEPRYILDSQIPLQSSRGTLYRMLLDLSLHEGETSSKQVAAYLGSPGRVLRGLGTHFGNPVRLAKIAVALSGLRARGAE